MQNNNLITKISIIGNRLLVIVLFSLLSICLTACNKAEGYITQSDTAATDDKSVTLSEDTAEDKLAVYVCGAVVNPGVYYLAAGAIVQDALIEAGGYADGASSNYVNLARRVADGERVYFPYEEELSGETSIAFEESEGESSGKVNINTADVALLMTLPGIGETRAKAIVAYREANGRFEKIEDICNVSGIKTATFNNIKEYIDVN